MPKKLRPKLAPEISARNYLAAIISGRFIGHCWGHSWSTANARTIQCGLGGNLRHETRILPKRGVPRTEHRHDKVARIAQYPETQGIQDWQENPNYG